MDELAKLKDQVLEDLIQVTDETDVDPADRFEILMSRYVNTGETALLNKAYDAAKAIPETAAKGSALMQLLEEINIAQADASAETAPEQTESNDQPPADMPVDEQGEAVHVNKE